MIDTGASSSYACSDLMKSIAHKPTYIETRCVEQMYLTMTRKVEINSITIASAAVEWFLLEMHCIKAEKPIITYLSNPRIKQLKQKYPRLRRLQISDDGSNERQLDGHKFRSRGLSTNKVNRKVDCWEKFWYKFRCRVHHTRVDNSRKTDTRII